MKSFLVVILFICILLSCSSNHNSAHNESNAAQIKSLTTNFGGTFAGLIPCADCPGIEITVSFNPDSSYSESLIYQERNSSFKDSGHWAKEGQILTIHYNDKKNEPRYFLVRSDSAISWLDADKKEIEGPLKDHYILKRQ